MMREVCGRLLGNRRLFFNFFDAADPTVTCGGIASNETRKNVLTQRTAKPEEVRAQTARFLSERIQGSPGECPGRNPDMSMRAAIELRKTLAKMEAANLLTHNREKLLQDITNPG